MNDKITEDLKRINSIQGPDVSAIESDESDNTIVNLLQRLGYISSEITCDDIEIVRYVCALVSVRNALLCAASELSINSHTVPYPGF